MTLHSPAYDPDLIPIQPSADLVPENLRESLQAYVDTGRPTGGFLKACLANDFLEAFARADHISLQVMPHIAAWIWMHAPHLSHGSYETVEAWEQSHAEKRRQAREKAEAFKNEEA